MVATRLPPGRDSLSMRRLRTDWCIPSRYARDISLRRRADIVPLPVQHGEYVEFTGELQDFLQQLHSRWAQHFKEGCLRLNGRHQRRGDVDDAAAKLPDRFPRSVPDSRKTVGHAATVEGNSAAGQGPPLRGSPCDVRRRAVDLQTFTSPPRRSCSLRKLSPCRSLREGRTR